MPWAQRFCRSCRVRIPAGIRCDDCARDYEEQRGARQQRGYDAAHDAERRRCAPLVATGTVMCWRCGEVIKAGEDWHLDHTDDRTGYLGPSHALCNIRAGGYAAHR